MSGSVPSGASTKAGEDEPFIIASDFLVIDAPVAKVWDVLTDFPNYGAWNPLCHTINVDPKIGGKVEMQVKDGALGQIVSLDYVLSGFEERRLLAWTGFFPEMGLVARRDQYVQALDVKKSIYWTVDVYVGAAAGAAAKSKGAWVRAAFNDMAMALRQRAEPASK